MIKRFISFCIISLTLTAIAYTEVNNKNSVCHDIKLKKVDSLSPYEYTTISDILERKYIGVHGLTLYNVDYEYNTKSVGFVLMYDGDILGSVKAWFLNSDQKLYLQSAKFAMINSKDIILSVNYQDSKSNDCFQKIKLQ